VRNIKDSVKQDANSRILFFLADPPSAQGSEEEQGSPDPSPEARCRSKGTLVARYPLWQMINIGKRKAAGRSQVASPCIQGLASVPLSEARTVS
jgi:hypothetical protein